MSLKTKLKGGKWYNKALIAQDAMKLLELVRSIVCGVEAYLKVTWAMMKANKCLYTFFHKRNTTNNDYMEYFEAYIMLIELFGVKTSIHPGTGYLQSNLRIKLSGRRRSQGGITRMSYAAWGRQKPFW